tara:strand:+ start:1488 stop:2546 length:1059 start_codon:yes stop_codon:yes gene_type:complete
MKYVLITGSSGLVGSECSIFFNNKNFKVLGIDNDSRSYFFGSSSSTNKMKNNLIKSLKNFEHYNVDIRNLKKLEKIFKKYKNKIKCIIHCAAQPSHDWAIKEPLTDFSINANGTLNLLYLTKKYCNKSVFIYVSTNKVYGDLPNFLPLKELKTRYEIKSLNNFSKGVNEKMSIDKSLHSLFGISKTSGDLLTQEYGKNLKIKTGIFRLGCITGENHAGAELHGFLSYLFKATKENIKYKIFGYKGKQVRDNIHAKDLVNCFWNFYLKPKYGEVYNIGGGRKNSCSILEAIDLIEKQTEKKLRCSYVKKNRTGDHIWYITDSRKFKKHYPNWKIQYSLKKIIREMDINYKKNN